MVVWEPQRTCLGTESVPASAALTCRRSTRDPVKTLMDRWGCPALLTAVGVDTRSGGAGSSFTLSSASHRSPRDASSGGLDACTCPVALVQAIHGHELCSYCPSVLRSMASYRWQQACLREVARSTIRGSHRNRIRPDDRQVAHSRVGPDDQPVARSHVGLTRISTLQYRGW